MTSQTTSRTTSQAAPHTAPHASQSSTLATDLRGLVSWSVALLGRVIHRELGQEAYERIESIRSRMADLREKDEEHAFSELRSVYEICEELDGDERRAIATAFTLMLETMNACENAYRSHRLTSQRKEIAVNGEKPSAIVYVLTAHPTEARSPHNIAAFHEIQTVLIDVLNGARADDALVFSERDEHRLLHWLEIAWRTPIVRDRAPKVKDEAEHIYTTALRPDVLLELLEVGGTKVPFYMRSWVGGDKDGHPGVDEKTLLESLNLSRRSLMQICLERLRAIGDALDLMTQTKELSALRKKLAEVERKLKLVRVVSPGDGRRVKAVKADFADFSRKYKECLGAKHPAIRVIKQLLHVFPGLVVPLELRESSDVLHSKPKGRTRLAIERMLATVAKLSQGTDPRWYARGFIISMTESVEDIKAAAEKQRVAFGALRLPIVPLFEQAGALADSETIVSEMLAVPAIRKAVDEYWNGQLELMVGYSDSSKEAGVLASRLAIAGTLPKLETLCANEGVTPVFFHGSGGSIDRGGGSIEDQTAWWPRSALRHYKVTVQGEMVERSFANPPIALGQVRHIVESLVHGLTKPTQFKGSDALRSFANQVSANYREKVSDPEFLNLVERATPYSYLSHLKIGSRPTKRSNGGLVVSGLRAIPWILCWTQTRVLFPTWWGVGSAWQQTSERDRSELKRAFKDEPVFTSYVKALGFTLAKVELPVWRTYLHSSSLAPERAQEAFALFSGEYKKAVEFLRELTGEEELLWFRPWLQESIRLRSPMIHPLNILQILSEKANDPHLLRVTVTGISSGLMTTG